MTAAEFANAVAYGQITPGPVTHTVALVGWAAAGPAGALLASAIAFAPSFALAFAGERFERLRQSAAARAFLDGAGPAAIGAILGAAAALAATLDAWWQPPVLAAAALALLRWRASPLPVLLGGALLGVAAGLAGLELPT